MQRLADAARALQESAQAQFDLALDPGEAEAGGLDRLINTALLDENLQPYFDGPAKRDLTNEESLEFERRRGAVRIPNEPLLFYCLGAFWGEWLCRHRNCVWQLFAPLNPLQAFPDMASARGGLCLLPFSHCTRKLIRPDENELAFKAREAARDGRGIGPFPLAASLADAEEAVAALLPEQGRAALEREREEDLSGALQLYALALDAAPGHELLLAQAIQAAWRVGDWERVYHWMQQSLRINPDNPVMQHNFGILLSQNPNFMDRAVQHVGRALELDPEYERARLSFAFLLLDQGRPAEARPHAAWILQHGQEFQGEAQAVLDEIAGQGAEDAGAPGADHDGS